MQTKIYTSLASIALFSLVIFSSCKKTVTISFDKSFDGIELAIDTTRSVGTFAITKANIATGISQLAADKGFDINNIKTVKIKSCIININDTSTMYTHINFNALDSVKATLSASGLSDVKVGSMNPILKNGATSLALNVNNADVAPYIKSSAFSCNVTGANNQPITHKLPLTATITFTIDASVTK
jgi:hypothetical protein